MEGNYMAYMIMNVSGTVCQLIHYLWQALKSKQCKCIELCDIISFQLLGEGGGGLIYFIVAATK